jgi:hypothetical protein
MAGGGEKRGLLKPVQRLKWQTNAPSKPGGAPSPAPAGAASRPASGSGTRPAPAARPKGMPSNAVPQAQYTLDQIKKMAASRGISVEKMLAQMVQQYLKEDGAE